MNRKIERRRRKHRYVHHITGRWYTITQHTIIIDKLGEYSKEVHATIARKTLVGTCSTVEALVSGHPRDVKKVSVTGAG